jgi:hypothetical protein
MAGRFITLSRVNRALSRGSDIWGRVRLITRRLATLPGLLTLFHSPLAAAFSLSEDGTRATLTGPVELADDVQFASFLAKPRAAPITLLYLNSQGGRGHVSARISRMIRSAHISTVVDASTSRCESGCTLIFAGGVRRYYLNASSVADGIGGGLGLAFHRGNDLNVTGMGIREDPRITRLEIDTLTTMGMPAAAGCVLSAEVNELYRISAKTALTSHVATSLTLP